MYHDLIQQLMRQDPAYWLWYALLRPDKHWHLISYPYYAKFARPGDSTLFRHIDINILQAISRGRSINAIQGTLSLDQETEGGCTQILPGIHKHLKEWWAQVEARGEGTSESVYKITEKVFTKGDAAEFGVDWTAQPCNALDVRITLPTLPHGSHGPCQKQRRTMLRLGSSQTIADWR
jgi:hypothetical protein